MRLSQICAMTNSLLAITLFFNVGLAEASGGDGYSENAFSPENHVPKSELARYAQDNLRIISPTYWRVYHFIAYRALTGHPLSKDEIASLKITGWKVGPANDDSQPGIDKDGVNGWLVSRKALTANVINDLSVETDAGDFTYFTNCQRDAFDRASQTLAQRRAQGGQQWASVWLKNQDAVFANCSPTLPQENRNQKLQRPLSLPAALPAKAPEWLIKDFSYQTTSAQFYAGRYDEARLGFLAIAKDSKSPWQSLGKYLAARCLVRKATLTISGRDKEAASEKGLSPEQIGLLSTARNEFDSLASGYPPAKAILGWIDIRLRPEQRRNELAAMLSTEPLNANSAQQLYDYLFLLDKIEGPEMLAASDDMSAWIASMQSRTTVSTNATTAQEESRIAALARARTGWKQAHALHWFVALLANAKLTELSQDEIKMATSVREDSAAYGNVQYFLAQGKLEQGKFVEADALVSAMLKKNLGTIDAQSLVAHEDGQRKNCRRIFRRSTASYRG